MSAPIDCIDCRLLHACCVIERIDYGASSINWTVPPVDFYDKSGDDGCLIGCIPEGVVVAFRGTEAPNDSSVPVKQRLLDWCSDFEANLRPMGTLPGLVHNGYASSLEELWPQIEAKLMELLSPGATVFLTGHSKGGGMAVLAAARLHMECSHWATGMIDVATFASPRAGNDTFAAEFNKAFPACRRYEFGNDLVVHLPPHSNVMALLNMYVGDFSRWIDVDYQSVGELIYIAKDGVPVFNTQSVRGEWLAAERLAGITEMLATLNFEQIVTNHRIDAGSGYMRGVCRNE